MATNSRSRRRARYLVPVGAAAVTAALVFIPQAASGAQHPNLPKRTAAQLLAAVEQAQTPQFSGTTVETARLGLPSLDDSSLAELGGGDGSSLTQIVTLLTGSHTAELAYGGPSRQRVAIFLSDLSETDVVHNGTDIWTYSSDSNSVSHKTVKPDAGQETTEDQSAPMNPAKAARQALAKINPSTQVTVDRTAEVAGRSAYQLVLTPRDSRTLIGSVRIALDSKTWLPLRVEIWSKNDPSTPAFSVGFTSISLKAPGASTFAFTKPPRASVQPFAFSGSESPQDGASSAQHSSADETVGKDWTSVLVEKLSSASTSSSQPPTGQSCMAIKHDSDTGATTRTKVSCVAPPEADSLSQTIDQYATKVAQGHLLTTALASVLVTNDNRLLVGAVTPQYLEQLASSGAGQ